MSLRSQGQAGAVFSDRYRQPMEGLSFHLIPEAFLAGLRGLARENPHSHLPCLPPSEFLMSLIVSADKPAHGPAGPLPSMLAASESVVWPGCGIRKDVSILKWNPYFTSYVRRRIGFYTWTMSLDPCRPPASLCPE